MKKYIQVITAILSLPFISQEENNLVLPELGDRVSGAVSTSEEKLIGKNF